MPITRNLQELNSIVERLKAITPRVCPRETTTLMYGSYTHRDHRWIFYIAGHTPFPHYGDNDTVFWGFSMDANENWMAFSHRGHWETSIKNPLGPHSYPVFEIFCQPMPLIDLLKKTHTTTDSQRLKKMKKSWKDPIIFQPNRKEVRVYTRRPSIIRNVRQQNSIKIEQPPDSFGLHEFTFQGIANHEVVKRITNSIEISET
jgi:hypothetical protein